MMHKLRISSYNCRGLPKSFTNFHLRPDLVDIFKNNDIICLQETWYAKQDLDGCNSLLPDFLAFSVAKTDLSDGILMGRPAGGASIFYRKSIAPYVKPIKFVDCDWCVGLDFHSDDKRFYLLNIYLPYEKSDNFDEYTDKLGYLASIVETFSHSCFGIIGDWNANVHCDNNGNFKSKFGSLANDFCIENELIFSSRDRLPPDTHTCISERWGTNSWLDHIIASSDFDNSMHNLRICYNLSCADHIPFNFEFCTGSLPSLVMGNPINMQNDSFTSIDWKNVNEFQDELFFNLTDLHAHNLLQEIDAINCHNVNCRNANHVSNLASIYDKMISVILKTGNRVYAKKATSTRRPNTKPGWAQHVAEKHSKFIEYYAVWKSSGKPRMGSIFQAYNKSKLIFKSAVRSIKRSECRIKADKAAEALNAQGF